MIRLFIFALSIFTVMVSCNSFERKEVKGLPSIALVVSTPSPTEKEVKSMPAIALIVRKPPPAENVIIAAEHDEEVQEDFMLADLQSDMIQAGEIIPELQTGVIQKHESERGPNTERTQNTAEAAMDLSEAKEENFRVGLRKAIEGNHKEAINAYRKAILINPDNKSAHHNIAVEYLHTGDIGSAAKEYKVLRNLDTEMAKTLYEKAVDMAFEDKDRTYTVQVGAYINKRFAISMSEALKSDYLTTYIEKENNFHNVRIIGIPTQTLGKEIVANVNRTFRIKSELMTSNETESLRKKNRSGNHAFSKNNYMVQVGAYRNINYATDITKKLQHDNMTVFIKKEGTFNKVRINGIKTVEDGNLLADNIYDKYKVIPFILLGK